MKKWVLLYGLMVYATVHAQEYLYDYTFFTNSRMADNYFFSRTAFRAPSFVKNSKQRLPVTGSFFHTPGNALQLEYVNGKRGSWTATVFRENLRSQDHFKPAMTFSFSVFVASANTASEGLPFYQLLMKDSSLSAKRTFTIHAHNAWEIIKAPLSVFKEINAADPEEVIGIVFSQNGNEGGRHLLYIDDIEFLPEEKPAVLPAKPEVLSCKGYARHIDITWKASSGEQIKYIKIYRSENGKTFIPVGIQSPVFNRFTDFTGITNKKYNYKISFLDYRYLETALSEAASAQTKEMTDDELLTMVQEACFRYYWDGAENNSGLSKENIPGRTEMIAAGASGFGIMALIAGTERRFITREQAVGRFNQITAFLERAEKFHGAFSHFLNGASGKVEPFFGPRDNGGDLVETSFLLQGLLAARAYFDKNDNDENLIRQRITAIWENVEWDWYRRYPGSKYLYWHWSPDKEWIINHRLTGWNETMVTYLLAIASPSHSVPASLYYSGWANQDSTGFQYRSNWGGTTDGAMYVNGNTYFGIKLDVGVSNGGPLFFTHYSYLGYDPHLITDRYTNYFTNNRNIALINYRYCVKNQERFQGYGDSCWGLTACDGPFSYLASEPVKGRNDGTVAPTGAISSFPYTPVESMKALKNYYYNYGKFLWGEYGFRDGFNLTRNWCSPIYMGLNQAPMVIMIENYRTGLLWKLFNQVPEAQQGLQQLRLTADTAQ